MSNLVETSVPGITSVLRETTALIKLGDDDDLPSRVFVGTDLFEGACAVVLPDTGSTGRDEHPLGAYNIGYPYCRTAAKVAVDDPDPNPLIAQVTSFARYLSARVVAEVCGEAAPLASFMVTGTIPAMTQSCAVFGVVHPLTRQGFLILDGTKVVLPLQILLQLDTAPDEHGNVYTRVGWVNVLPPGWVDE